MIGVIIARVEENMRSAPFPGTVKRKPKFQPRMQVHDEIKRRHAGRERGYVVVGECRWECVSGWACLVDEAGTIHQIGSFAG